MKRIKQEPVATAMLVTVITWLGLQFGVDVGTEPATAIAGLVLLVASWVARQRVTPVTTAANAIESAYDDGRKAGVKSASMGIRTGPGTITPREAPSRFRP